MQTMSYALSSVMLAQVMGPLLLVIGLGVLFNRSSFNQMIAEMIGGKQQLTLFVTGTLTTLLGLLVVIGHNVWVWNWTVLVTLLGWATLIKGIFLVLFPTASNPIAKFYQGRDSLITGAALVAIIMSLVLCYYGFIA